MNKIFFIFLFLLPAQTLLGCKCDKPPIYSRYMTADFIGIVEIQNTKNVPATRKQRYYMANLRQVQIFKGTMPDEIRVSGIKLENNSGSCEIAVKPGEQWLIYLQRNGNGNYYLSYCSHPVKMQNAKGEDLPIFEEAVFDLHQLQFLKDHVPELHSNQLISLNYYELWNFLKKYKGQSFERPSAYFQIKFDKSLNIEDIKVIRGFSDPVNQEIIQYLKTDVNWHTGHFRPNPSDSSTLKEATKYVIGIYYNEHDKSLSPLYIRSAS